MNLFDRLNNRKIKFLIILSIIIMFLGWAHIEYYNIKIKRITIISKEIPKEFDGKKVVFVADFQMDTRYQYNKRAVTRSIKKINSIDKDILLLGGDYVTWSDKIPDFYNDLKSLKVPKYGAFAILGNHDYDYLNIEKKSFDNENYTNDEKINPNINNLKKLGYEVLLNKNIPIKIGGNKIYIAGTHDLYSKLFDVNKTLEGINKDDFIIVMAHNPQQYVEEFSEINKEKSDLTLSGHTHGGQVTLFGLFGISPISPKYWIKYRYGMKNINNSKLYITSGLGGSALEMFVRFFAQPEIVEITLKRE